MKSNGKAGVVWHTQGSGKSMEMELYTNLIVTHPRMLNPTILVITDRKELDGQLYETFKRSTLLTEEPVQIRRRTDLRTQLSSRNSGGILFATLQKFGREKEERDGGLDHPLLTDRRKVIVIVDEAHRSHYDDLDGYARHLKDALPNATLIAFTGTPISETERNTREVFGDYIDIYDLSRAVADGATVPVYFQPRLNSAVLEQGEDVLAGIARELVGVMRRDTRTDWTRRDDVQATLRTAIRRLLRKHKYPPDKAPEAVKLVIEQMEVLAPEYAAA